MFEVDPQTTWIDPAAGAIHSLVQSLNTPLVAAGPHPAENVQGWIVSRDVGGAFNVFVFFHLTQSNQSVVYSWSDGAVPPPQLAYVQDEAMSFCESMGFMMDNLNFPGLPPEKRGELLTTLPPFVQDLASLVKEVKVEEVSSAKQVNPLDDFVRMKQARAEAGQLGTAEFMAASGESPASIPNEPMSGPSFDPSARVDRMDAPHLADSGELQIEITEIEGLELLQDPEPVRGVVAADPPVVRGSLPVMEAAPPPAMPPRMVREKTPAGGMKVFDEADFADPAPAPAPAPARPAVSAMPSPGPIPTAEPQEELSIDDMLADVASSSSGDDLSSELDDILDRVENSNPRVAEPAPVAAASANGNGADDFSLDIEMEEKSVLEEEDDPMKLLDAMVAAGDDPVPDPVVAAPSPTLRPPSPPPAPAPARLGKITPVAVPASEAIPAPGPSPLDALESAWMDGGAPAKANGNGNGAAAHPPARLDISTDDLARLLAML